MGTPQDHKGLAKTILMEEYREIKEEEADKDSNGKTTSKS